jgi:acetyl/propionyl-CoA carboxylase alpha subunit
VKYIVDVQGTRVTVGIGPDGVDVNGERATAHIADVEGTPVKLLTLGSAVHRVVVQRGAARGSYTLWVDGWRLTVEALDERTRTIRDLSAATAGAAGPAPLVAPMPGLIVRVLVEEGAEVLAGQPLAVMEAMKMENELRAPAPGRVSAIRASPGTAVEKGAVLIELS